MAELKVFNLEKSEVGSVELHDKVAQAELNPYIIKDVVVQYLAGKRQGTHKTKNRSEVKGSRKKLFRQKGTGNARMGSLQSPVRRHGGTVFGPVPRDHSFSLNKKVKKAALASVISEKLRNDEFMVVDQVKLASHKTKDFVQILGKMGVNEALVILADVDENLAKASRNLQNVKVIHSSSMNVYDVLNYKNVIISRDALLDVEGRLLK